MQAVGGFKVSRFKVCVCEGRGGGGMVDYWTGHFSMVVQVLLRSQLLSPHTPMGLKVVIEGSS